MTTARDARMAARRTPGWKALARWGRDSFYRVLTPVDCLLPGRRSPLLPPAHLRKYYYRTLQPAAFARACEDARLELVGRNLQPTHRVLDIGSGIGNLALGLRDYLTATYDGIDVHREAVEWCQQAITPRYPRFRFHAANLASRAYNPAGRDLASGYRFPFADRQFDFVFLGSVFTHMLPEDVSHYLDEIARLLSPGGRSIASCFLLTDETRPAVEAGRSFIPFPVLHASGVCRLHKAAVPEAAVAYEEAFIRERHARLGLRIDEVRRGQWWSGRAHDQDVIAATLSS